jgi:hypothetical protein
MPSRRPARRAMSPRIAAAARTVSRAAARAARSRVRSRDRRRCRSGAARHRRDHHVNGIRGPERTRQTVQRRRRPQPQDDAVGQRVSSARNPRSCVIRPGCVTPRLTRVMLRRSRKVRIACRVTPAR